MDTLSWKLHYYANFEVYNIPVPHAVISNGIMTIKIKGELVGENNFAILNVYIEGIDTPIKALIDTGASSCLLKPELLTTLNLPVLYTRTINHVLHGTMETSYHKVNLKIGNMMYKSVHVTTIHGELEGIDMVIGTSLLQNFTLEYGGDKRTFELSYRNKKLSWFKHIAHKLKSLLSNPTSV